MTLLKNENLTTKFEPTEHSDVLNKFYLDEKIKKIDAHTSSNKIYYSEFKLQYNKQSVEETLNQRAVKTIIQIHYDKGISIIFRMLIKFSKIFL